MTAYTPPTSNNIVDHIFRAYDIRGHADRDLNDSMVYGIGLSLGTLLQDSGQTTCVLGYDGRLSSPRINQALTEGLLATGINIVHVGEVPTPVVYFATFHLGIPTGIQITGSHNPKDDNGIKIALKDPSQIHPLIESIPKHMAKEQWKKGEGNLIKQDVVPAYIEKIASIPLKRPPHVVIDCGNGIAGRIAPTLFETLGCRTTSLFCDVDGHFPNHHPDPTVAKNLKDCQKKVAECQAEVGFIFDGDADRVGVITHQGDIVWADQLMMLFAEDILRDHPGAPIVFDIKCSDHLGKCIEKHQGKPILWHTGHTKIKAKMKAIGAPLAGEMSGHIFFNDEDWYGFDDGLYGAVRLLRMLDRLEVPLQSLLEALPKSHATPEILLPVEEKQKFTLIDELKLQTALQAGSINDIDGLRISFDQGWGLVRASNTTANLSLRFEADSPDALSRIMDDFHGALHDVGAIPKDYQWPN